MEDQKMEDKVRFTPGGPRPAEKVHLIIPEAERAVPPGGPRHRSRVRRVESGARLEFRAAGGARLRARDNPGPPDQANWITYAGWTNTTGNPITQFTTTWTVPPAPPTQASQLLYLFNGIEPADGQVILQPVLQWGDSGSDEDGQNRTGPFWTVASWMVGGPDGAATHTPHIRVNPGDVLVGVMTLTNQSPAGFVYTCEFQGLAGTTLTTPQISELVWCVETLEAYELQGNHVAPYDLDAASEYPATPVAFQAIGIVTNAPGPAGPWAAQNIVSQYGENTTIAADNTTNGSIVIAF
jgi:hypothetical protein